MFNSKETINTMNISSNDDISSSFFIFCSFCIIDDYSTVIFKMY